MSLRFCRWLEETFHTDSDTDTDSEPEQVRFDYDVKLWKQVTQKIAQSQSHSGALNKLVNDSFGMSWWQILYILIAVMVLSFATAWTVVSVLFCLFFVVDTLSRRCTEPYRAVQQPDGDLALGLRVT